MAPHQSKTSKPTKSANKSKSLKKTKALCKSLILACGTDSPEPSHVRKWDKFRFENLEVQDLHDKWTKKRSFIQERDFPIATIPRFYGLLWERDEGYCALVQEYYAHAAYYYSLDCHVKGCRIKIDEAAIRAFFNLPVVSKCHYQHSMDHLQEVTWDDVVKELTIPSQQEWCVKKHGTKYIKQCRLNRDANYWHHFLAANVMPISHLSKVYYDRALLLYHLLRGNPVDFAAIMIANLEKHIRNHNLGLVFPHFISKLCINQKVKIIPHEPKLKPKPKFNYKSVKVHEAMNDGEQQEEAPQPQVQNASNRLMDTPSQDESNPRLKRIEKLLLALTKGMRAIAKAVGVRMPLDEVEEDLEKELDNDVEEDSLVDTDAEDIK